MKRNGWEKYQIHVLAELKRLNIGQENVWKAVSKIRTEDLKKVSLEIATLKVKASIWGGIVGSLGGALIVIVAVLVKVL